MLSSNCRVILKLIFHSPLAAWFSKKCFYTNFFLMLEFHFNSLYFQLFIYWFINRDRISFYSLLDWSSSYYLRSWQFCLGHLSSGLTSITHHSWLSFSPLIPPVLAHIAFSIVASTLLSPLQQGIQPLIIFYLRNESTGTDTQLVSHMHITSLTNSYSCPLTVSYTLSISSEILNFSGAYITFIILFIFIF